MSTLLFSAVMSLVAVRASCDSCADGNPACAGDTKASSLLQIKTEPDQSNKWLFKTEPDQCEESSAWGQCMPSACSGFFDSCLGHGTSSVIGSWSDFNGAFETCCLAHYNSTGMCAGLDELIQQGERTEPNENDCAELQALRNAHNAREVASGQEAILLQQGKGCPCIQQAAGRMERMQEKHGAFMEKMGGVLANPQNSAILLALGLSVGSVTQKLAQLAVGSRHAEEVWEMEGSMKACTIL